MKTKLQIALDLAEAGFPVFAVLPNAKAPATPNGFLDATLERETIERWWKADENFNIGLSTGPAKLTVVDVDPGGEEAWADLCTAHKIPVTCTVKTKRGHHYYFYGVTPGSTVGKLAPHIDTRSEKGYVLAAGSTIDGVDYDYTNEESPSELPEAIKALLAKPTAAIETAQPGVELDSETSIAGAVAYLQVVAASGDVPIAGQGGDNRSYAILAELRDRGLSQAKALDIFSNFNLAYCQPPWDAADLERLATNVFNYAQNAAGSKANPPGAEVFGEVIEREPRSTEPRADAGFVSFGTLIKRTPKLFSELIRGLVEQGTTTFISAPGGTNKSRILLQWGLTLAASAFVWGRVSTPCKFIYLSGEDDIDEVTRRVHSMVRTLKLPPETVAANASYCDCTSDPKPLLRVSENGTIEKLPYWRELCAHLTTIPGHKLIGLDSTYNFLIFEGAAKINEASVKAAIDALNALCAECDATVVALYHPSRAGSERGDNTGWSVAWENTARNWLSLKSVEDAPETYEMAVQKRNHGPKGEPILLHWDNGTLRPATSEECVAQSADLVTAIVAAAIEFAEVESPIKRNGRLQKWQLERVEELFGQQPTQRQIRDTLELARSHNLLCYVTGHGHTLAGYRAAEPKVEPGKAAPPEELATTLAADSFPQSKGSA